MRGLLCGFYRSQTSAKGDRSRAAFRTGSPRRRRGGCQREGRSGAGQTRPFCRSASKTSIGYTAGHEKCPLRGRKPPQEPRIAFGLGGWPRSRRQSILMAARLLGERNQRAGHNVAGPPMRLPVPVPGRKTTRGSRKETPAASWRGVCRDGARRSQTRATH